MAGRQAGGGWDARLHRHICDGKLVHCDAYFRRRAHTLLLAEKHSDLCLLLLYLMQSLKGDVSDRDGRLADMIEGIMAASL